MVVQHKLYTFEEFEQFLALPENQERKFALLEGEIIEVSPSRPHSLVAGNFFGRLFNWLAQHGKGEVHIELRYKLPESNDSALIPDVSYIADATGLPEDDSPIPRMPDVAIEVKSPTDSYTGQRRKAAYYIANGTQLAVLAFPEKKLAEAYRPGADVEILTLDDALEGGDALPGFRVIMREVFEG